VECPVAQWSFFEATGRLYGRGATEAREEDGGVNDEHAMWTGSWLTQAQAAE